MILKTMTQPFWHASPKAGTVGRNDWPASTNSVAVQTIVEAICSDAMLDGFTDMTIGRIAAKTGVRADVVDDVIAELIATGLVYVRYSVRRARRILEPGPALRAVYRLVPR
jgi:hypothetical protein